MGNRKAADTKGWPIKIICVLAVLTGSFFLLEATAQESLNTAGGDFAGNGGSASYSIGQLVYRASQDNAGSVEKGVQHPYEISIVNGIKDDSIDLAVSAFPNPATDILILKVYKKFYSTLSYQLFDTNGKILDNGKISSVETTLSINDLGPGNYILKVTDGVKVMKTFKIIKN